MRKKYCLIILSMLCLMLAACQSIDKNPSADKSFSDTQIGTQTTFDSVIYSEINQETATEGTTATEVLTTQKSPSASSELSSEISSVTTTVTITQETYDEPQKVDIDLTPLSSTMVYAELYNIFGEADMNVGKVIKMTGQFDVYVLVK